MTAPGSPSTPLAADDAHLAALGYGGDFHRSMSLWSNIALGFTYLSPLVGGVLAGRVQPVAGWAARDLVDRDRGMRPDARGLVFGEVVSQYHLAGGIYQWCRRLGAVGTPGSSRGCTCGRLSSP
jgi:hypothetical protein